MPLIVSCPQTCGADLLHFDHVPTGWDLRFCIVGSNWIGWTAEQRSAIERYRETIVSLALAGF